MNKIIAVDIDETCVDVVPVWNGWCKTFFGGDYDGNEYSLVDIYGEEAMTFWSTPFLYQKLKPKVGCVEALSQLYLEGWEIGFVSYAKKAHLSSKCKWIKKHFPFYSFIHATKEKGYTRCSVFIDDRVKYLNQQPKDVHCIQYMTPYTQDELPKREIKACNTWDEIVEYIDKLEKEKV